MPVLCYGDGEYRIVDDLELSEEAQKRIIENV